MRLNPPRRGGFTPACDCSRVAGRPHLEALSSHLEVCKDHLESRSSNGVTRSSHMAALPPVIGLRDQRSLCCCSYARHICTSSLPPFPSAPLAVGKQACCVSLHQELDKPDQISSAGSSRSPSQCLFGSLKDAEKLCLTLCSVHHDLFLLCGLNTNHAAAHNCLFREFHAPHPSFPLPHPPPHHRLIF